MNNFSVNIAFTSDVADYELLTNSLIKSAIKTRLGISTDDEYLALLKNGIGNMGFCVFGDTRISINNEPYDYQEPIQHIVAGDNNVNPNNLITSIKVEKTGVSGTFYFRIG